MLGASQSMGRCVMFASRARCRIGRNRSSFVLPGSIMQSSSGPEGIMQSSSGPARCIFYSMHSAFSQHAAHCVLSSRISHCSHPFAGPVRSSAPSRQVAPSSEKCGILHVASSKQQAAEVQHRGRIFAASSENSACSRQRQCAASCMQRAADSAACCICTKYLFRGLHSARYQ